MLTLKQAILAQILFYAGLVEREKLFSLIQTIYYIYPLYNTSTNVNK